jgi:hypothetical protein
VKLVLSLISLSFFYTGTTHKISVYLAKIDGDLYWYLDADLADQYWLEQQRQRVADKAFPERIAKQVGG